VKGECLQYSYSELTIRTRRSHGRMCDLSYFRDWEWM